MTPMTPGNGEAAMNTMKHKTRIQCRMGLPLTLLTALTMAALATGSPVFLAAAILLGALLLSGVTGVLWAAGTLQVVSLLSDTTVQRGENVMLEAEVRHRGLIPIAPMTVIIAAGPDRPEQTLKLTGQGSRLTLHFHASHVGVTRPGVKQIVIRDLMGWLRIEKLPDVKGGELIVLPLPFDVGELTFAAGDSGSESMARASEDITSPAEVRTYQPGDAMKKIHWKLSLRKRELLVRTYEEPVMPDALVLLDCSAPPRQADEAASADLRDALLETAASVMQANVVSGHPARLPVHGDHPIELDKNMGMPMILESLARVDFTGPDKPERMLHLEMRRMRKVGCTVVVSARLNSRMVDVMASMRRMGPYVRLYLVTFDPEDERVLPMISRLQNEGVEVCYVTPMAM